MIKNKFTRVKIIIMSVLTIIPISASAYDYESSETSEFDYAPIIFIEDDSELPESMRRNIEICNNKEYIEEENEIDFPISANFSNDNGISPYAIIYPTVFGFNQFPQEENYYCGYASMQSVLDYHNISKSQYVIAGEAYEEEEALPWFIGSNAQATNEAYYPAAVYLNSLLTYQYKPYNSYFGTYTESELSEKLLDTISGSEEGVLICGTSKANEEYGSKLPNYPNMDITHWIVAYKIAWDIDKQSVTDVYFVDPAKSEAVPWSGSISAYSSTELGRMFKFSQARGIMY